MKKAICPIAVFVIGILISILLLFTERGYPIMFEWLSPETARLYFWITVGITILFSSGLAIFLYWKHFFPAKLKVNELTCWHIEREEPEHHTWHHCHEYNFAGEISIIPRTNAFVTAFYLELPMRNKQALRVESQMISPNVLSKITPDEPIVENYSFQIRFEKEIKIPSRAYVVMKFKHGKAKRKVILKVDDEYRPYPSYIRRCG